MLRGYLIDQTRHGKSNGLMAVAVVAGLLAAGPSMPAYAFDDQQKTDQGNVRALFKFGFSAYKRGEKEEALTAYRDAAKHGHTGARWKLANMYAAGDGVPEDDFEAFRLFESIVTDGAEPDAQESSFVANAMVSLAGYVKRGIPGSPISADPRRARDLYWQAAANFGEPNAQFELGRMFLRGEGGGEDPRQAARWFNLSAQKGHVGAQAMLGHMLFERGKYVRGLAMMTAALREANERDRIWIRELQEDAFAVASEADRRTAIALSEDTFAR